MQNEILEQKRQIPLDEELDYLTIKNEIDDFITCDLYSYFVCRKNNTIVVKIAESNVPDFNTLHEADVKNDIVDRIIDYIMTLSDTKCVCFGQPPIELSVELYQPMIQKMAKRLNAQWKQFEYEDLVSIGNLTMVELYRKGYYLNKSLIWTSMNNKILTECRQIKQKPIIVSIYDTIKSDVKSDSAEIAYGDIIEDESYKNEKEDEDEQQLEKYIFEQVKDIIVEKIGQRQWDQLWRDYSKRHTSNATRVLMNRMKSYFNELGLTRQNFINSYRR